MKKYSGWEDPQWLSYWGADDTPDYEDYFEED